MSYNMSNCYNFMIGEGNGKMTNLCPLIEKYFHNRNPSHENSEFPSDYEIDEILHYAKLATIK